MLFKRISALLIWVVTSVCFAQESRIRVVILDSGMPPQVLLDKFPEVARTICKNGHLDLTGMGLVDRHGHGTHMLGLVAANLDYKKYCITVVKWFDTEANNAQDSYFRTLLGEKYSLHIGAKFINMSFGGTVPLHEEYVILLEALNRGIKIAVAAGNNGQDLSKACNYYPACYAIKSPFFKVVGSLEKENSPKKAEYSNFNGPVNAWEVGTARLSMGFYMNGTSQATAAYMGKWVAGHVE